MSGATTKRREDNNSFQDDVAMYKATNTKGNDHTIASYSP